MCHSVVVDNDDPGVGDDCQSDVDHWAHRGK